MRPRWRSGAISWIASVLAALAAAAALLAAHLDHSVYDADGFADRAAATLDHRQVRATVARRLTDEAVAAEPSLIAVRALIEQAAEGVVGTEAFRSLLRGAARDVHRSALDGDAGTVTLRLADAGVLLAGALEQLRPEVADRIPERAAIGLAAISDGTAAAALHLTERAHRVRRGGWVALALALALAGLATATAPRPRTAASRLGWATAVTGGLLALAATAAPAVLTSDAALREVLGTWTRPLALYALALGAIGGVVVVAAASAVRPVRVLATVRLWAHRLGAHPVRPGWAAGRAAAGVALGAAAVLDPGGVARVVVTLAGVGLGLAGVAELLRLAADPVAPERAERGSATASARRGRAWRIMGAAALAAVAVGVTGAVAGSKSVALPARTGACNGHAELCSRRVDQVAFVGTHNAMAADREPSWLFPAQDASMEDQLRDGVRSLLIDTHYGFATSRGVATDLSGQSKSRDKLEAELGTEFTDAAERIRRRIGHRGGASRSVFLCHGFCEVGATDAVQALTVVHRFLVTHPDEVLILSIEDDTQAADTVKVLERSGLADEVYRGPAGPAWPTLGELIERDERVVVLAENHAADGPSWMHAQDAVAQETPYAFPTPARLEAPESCEPNRGGTAGSLFLLNHWVDTTPAPRPANASTVNARAVLERRLAECRRRRGTMATIVAVDFYRRGDVFAVVDRLNGIAHGSG